MPGIEEELREAISYRNEMAVELASNLLFLASEGDWRGISIGEGAIIGGRYDKFAADIEALTAVILQRAGMPWDVLAAPADISKQALHRRLGSRGEKLFEESLERSDQRETDPRALIRFLRKAERADGPQEASTVLRSLPWQSSDLIWRLVTLPDPADIVTAPTRFAARLSELRKIPRWWIWRE